MLKVPIKYGANFSKWLNWKFGGGGGGGWGLEKSSSKLRTFLSVNSSKFAACGPIKKIVFRKDVCRDRVFFFFLVDQHNMVK